MRTHSTKPDEIVRDWWVVDADGVVLGRLASEVAQLL
ncbi:MAG TPA: 50S ribosomal protein L13, partial [Actinomycetota bacterium]|nr:50S ribosomal protein L13 [Actinomycetota bacterium]